eukprot:CAMPEP_0201580604 /NCGR_PEP_ID=MMETSP0190_2-20130828/51517_1 /ASSEMBLY_ACC=CAM_ASM_000263 /TAXON_ID=37353 /ORGANISM="Rosalina sp." /LENGTH=210 /DNA_ID=CAMNT_0048017017 /DNA_START=88 /DNA_END=717 /DNA_ORIENTATION=+
MMLALVISYFLIIFSNGACPYYLGGLGPQPINECTDYTVDGNALSSRVQCVGTYDNGTDVVRATWNSAGCDGTATDFEPLFTIGDSDDTATGCDGSCDGLVARLKISFCADVASCASGCDGDYRVERFVVDTCYQFGDSYAKMVCTNSGMIMNTYSDSECTMGETEAESITNGCGTDDSNESQYWEIEECPLDDSSAGGISLFAAVVFVI